MSELAELSGSDVALPVAATLAGLWASPAPPELAAEAAARAMFRELLTTGETAAPGGPGWSEVPDVPARVLPGPAGRGGPNRRRRRAGPGRGWSRMAVIVSAGAATVAVGAVAVAAVLSGSVGQPGPRETGSSAAYGSSAYSSATGTEGVAGGGTAASDPTPTPSAIASPAGTPTAGPAYAPRRTSSQGPASTPGSARPTGPAASPLSTSDPAALCREVFAFSSQTASPGDWVTEVKLIHELSDLAGGSWKIYGYCAALLPAGTLPSGGPSAWPTEWPTSRPTSWPGPSGPSATTPGGPGATAPSDPWPTQSASRPGRPQG